MRIAVYTRVSTQEQALNGHSIVEQEQRARMYCDALGWSISKVYRDGGYSGSSMDRPALKQLISDVESGNVNKVLVYKLDRLSRSQLDTLYLIEKVFLAHGTDFVSMSENFDTATPFGKAMIGILAVFAQLEREQIRERLTMGKFARAKQGYYSSSKPPIGYDYVNGELVTDEFEKAQIQRIFDAYSAGISPKRIAEDLNNTGMVHKYGNWQSSTVRSLLTSRIYLGYNRYRDEWYAGSHEAFVTQEQFDRVQKMIQRKTEEHLKLNRRSGKATSYLGGFLYCGKCGAKYSKITYKSKAGGKEYSYAYYVCNSRSKKTPHLVKDDSCLNKNWRMEELDNLIFDEIRKLQIGDYMPDPQPDPKPAVESEIRKISDQIEKLMDLYAVNGIPLDRLQERIRDLDDRRHKLSAQLEKPDDGLKQADAKRMIESFSDVLEYGNMDEIRTVIGALIKKIVIVDNDVTIHWNF